MKVDQLTTNHYSSIMIPCKHHSSSIVRNQRLFTVVLLFLVAGLTPLHASPRSFDQAKAVAVEKATSLGLKLGQQSIMKAKTHAEAMADTTFTDCPYYIFNFDNSTGYAVVSGEDKMPAIVGYSSKGSLDEERMPPGLKDFLAAYKATVDSVRRGNRIAIANVRAATRRVTGSITPVEPLLGGIVWNQGAPFNNQCPLYDGENHAVTGCVATAMAQIMRYWKYPEQLKEDIGTYEISYINYYTGETWTNTYGGIEKGIAYDWDNMLENYNSTYNEAQADAVATLMLHCGTSVQMQYASSSGAYSSDVPGAFVKQFGYDEDLVQHLQRNIFDWDEWNEILQRELYEGRPFYYSGFASIGGHAFVCDGIDADGYYHINWGWGGVSDDYFDITILNPYDRGAGADSSSDGFNSDNEIVIGLKPDNGVKDDPLVTFDKLIIYSSYIDVTKYKREKASENFTGNVSMYLQNLNDTVYKALFAVAIKNEDGSFTPIAPAKEVEIGSTGEYGSYYVGIDFDYSFPVGQYYLYGIESTDGGTTWKACYGNKTYGISLNVTEQYIQVSNTDLSKGVVVDGIRYELFPETSSATVIANDYVEDVVIPEKFTYEGQTYSVTALGEESLSGCTYLTSVVVPSSVKTLGNACFGNAYNLVSASLPEGITTIPVNCFVSNYKLPSFTIPESVTSLEEGAFGICFALTQLTIPAKVNYIGINCFWASDAIKQLTCLAETPPTCLSLPEYCDTLYVPKTSLDAYKKVSPWSSIANILPINPDIEISQTSAMLKPNETLQLTATVHSTETGAGNVEWLSSSPAVATVSDNGLVTAISEGTATITADVTVDGLYQTASCKVTVTSEDWMEVKSVDDLKVGALIRIYPYGQSGVSSMALSSNTSDAILTSTEEAGEEGNVWNLEDAGDGYYYIKNDLGLYWAYQQSYNPYSNMYTKSSQSEAVKVKLVWNTTYPGVAFKNAYDGTYLNNFFGTNENYNWYDGEPPLTYDTNSTYHVYFTIPDENLFDSFSFDQHELTFELDGTKWGFHLYYSPSDADVSKISLNNSDESVATVSMSKTVGDNNYIFISLELLKVGTTVITAKTTDGSNLSDQCVINVIDPTGIDGITTEDNKNTIYYNIDGTNLISRPQRPGIYIRDDNGRRQKVIVR